MSVIDEIAAERRRRLCQHLSEVTYDGDPEDVHQQMISRAVEYLLRLEIERLDRARSGCN